MRKAHARERILDAAGKLFQERGYSQVGVNEIIATADTAKASFYHYFSSKETLCQAWLEAIHHRSDASREALLKSGKSPAEKIDQYFAELEKFLVSSHFRGCPYSNTGAVVSCESRGISEQIQNHKESIRDFFQMICSEHFTDKKEARRMADHLFLLYSGATTESQNMKDIWPAKSAREAAGLLMRKKKS